MENLIILSIAIIVSIFVCRAVFSIPKIVFNLEEHTRLLKVLAGEKDEIKPKEVNIELERLKGKFHMGEMDKKTFEKLKNELNSNASI